jgi:hypothetical protein
VRRPLLKKLSGEEANSPFIISIGWSSAPPGGTTGFSVTIHNPDPFPYSEFSLFAYTVFGAANTIQSADLSLTAVDARFPRYWRGLGVAAGGSATASSTIAVPAGITPGSTSAAATWFGARRSTQARSSSGLAST